MTYLTSWFFVDVFSIIPFDLIFNNDSNNANRVTRFSRINKIYRLVRLAKTFRIFRIAQVKNKLYRHMNETLKISAGTERLISMLLVFFVLVHISACLW